MLIEFSVGNYLSFKDTVTFSMVAAKIPENNDNFLNNICKIDEELSLLKTAAIYGANASGKSNIATAIEFMKWFVLNSSKETQVTDTIPVETFRLSTETENKPSFFEIIFLLEGKIYRYGFEVDNQQVVSEWLFYTPKTKEIKLFERNFKNFQVVNSFKNEGKEITNKTRNNALFLSVVAQFNGKISQKILSWFGKNLNIISGLDDDLYQPYTVKSFEDKQHKKDIVEFVKRLDVGIDDIKIENIIVTDELLNNFPEDVKNLLLRSKAASLTTIKTIHRKYDHQGQAMGFEIFDFDKNESQGTQKLFALTGLILDTLRNGKVILIDELDARLHPLITCEIIKLFNANETNRGNAQLIFMTHDTNLLNKKIFRKDQIWFTEKDKKGSTHLYSLVEYKLENNDVFGSDYIRGKYGAIPLITL